MGGDLAKIQTVGEYLIEVWKAAGMRLDHVEFLWASAEITSKASTYWPIMLNIARQFNITRIKKCCQIMGRLENSLSAAQILYPLMQCTDVFFLKADICQLGVDQRKVNMLAREYCDAAASSSKGTARRNVNKPIILSHHMLYGLKAGQAKMSKSDPDSAIFMEDSVEDVTRKIRNAYCPRHTTATATDNPQPQQSAADADGATREGSGDCLIETTVTSEGIEAAPKQSSGTTAVAAQSENESDKVVDEEQEEDAGKASMQLIIDTLKNPCLDYIQHIILSPPGATFHAAEKEYENFDSVKLAFLDGSLTEHDLKEGLIGALNQLLEPVRHHFTHNERAKDLLAKVQEYKRESVSSSASSFIVRRLNLVQLGKIPAKCHLVVAGLPNTNPTLQEAMDVLARLRSTTTSVASSSSAAAEKTPIVLLLQDWSAVVCNACQADAKGIAAFYTVLIATLKALDPDIMSRVQIVFQSEAILADPSNYWISVINVGRHFMLNQIMGCDMEDSECVGIVIARLMTVADVAGVEPATVAFAPTTTNSIEQNLVEEFFASKLPGVSAPSISVCCCEIIRLQPERESEGLKTEYDEYFLLDDPKVSFGSFQGCIPASS